MGMVMGRAGAPVRAKPRLEGKQASAGGIPELTNTRLGPLGTCPQKQAAWTPRMGDGHFSHQQPSSSYTKVTRWGGGRIVIIPPCQSSSSMHGREVQLPTPPHPHNLPSTLGEKPEMMSAAESRCLQVTRTWSWLLHGRRAGVRSQKRSIGGGVVNRCLYPVGVMAAASVCEARGSHTYRNALHGAEEYGMIPFGVVTLHQSFTPGFPRDHRAPKWPVAELVSDAGLLERTCPVTVSSRFALKILHPHNQPHHVMGAASPGCLVGGHHRDDQHSVGGAVLGTLPQERLQCLPHSPTTRGPHRTHSWSHLIGSVVIPEGTSRHH